MPTTPANADLAWWQRYRRPALTFLLAAALVAGLKLAFPDVDFSRGSSERWWLIGAAVVFGLVLFGVKRYLARRACPRSNQEGA